MWKANIKTVAAKIVSVKGQLQKGGKVLFLYTNISGYISSLCYYVVLSAYSHVTKKNAFKKDVSSTALLCIFFLRK